MEDAGLWWKDFHWIESRAFADWPKRRRRIEAWTSGEGQAERPGATFCNLIQYWWGCRVVLIPASIQQCLGSGFVEMMDVVKPIEMDLRCQMQDEQMREDLAHKRFPSARKRAIYNS